MQIKHLIETLEKFNPELELLIENCDGNPRLLDREDFEFVSLGHGGEYLMVRNDESKRFD